MLETLQKMRLRTQKWEGMQGQAGLIIGLPLQTLHRTQSQFVVEEQTELFGKRRVKVIRSDCKTGVTASRKGNSYNKFYWPE